MATVSNVSGEGLLAPLGRDLYDDYFSDTVAEGGDSTVGGVFPKKCALDLLADDLLQEAYKVFERGQENCTTILDGKPRFANPKTEDVAAARRTSIPKKTQIPSTACACGMNGRLIEMQ